MIRSILLIELAIISFILFVFYAYDHLTMMRLIVNKKRKIVQVIIPVIIYACGAISSLMFALALIRDPGTIKDSPLVLSFTVIVTIHLVELVVPFKS